MQDRTDNARPPAACKSGRPDSVSALPFPQWVLWASLSAALGGATASAHAQSATCTELPCQLKGNYTYGALIQASGKNGKDGDTSVFTNGEWGEDGGHGSNRTIELVGNPQLSGIGMWVQTHGGNGGAGGTSTFAANGVGGSGGNGGNIVVRPGSLQSTPGFTYPAVVLSSAGGNAGKGRDGASHASRTVAGNGGNITATFLQDTHLKSASGAALKASSAGGQGGEGRALAPTAGSEPGGGGGKAGHVRIEAAGRYSTTSASSPGITIGSMGGDAFSPGHSGPGGAAGVVRLILGQAAQAGEPTLVETSSGNSPGAHVFNQGGKGSGHQSAGGSAVARFGAAANGRDEVADVVATVNRAHIITHGADSSGLIAESLGGQGGVGKDYEGRGEDGGAGGAGGKVNVLLGAQSEIRTDGARSHGASAVSRGGDGGKGGGGLSTNGARGVGGPGGNGGDAGDVALTAQGFIETRGQDAYGAYAASLGGKSGAGGFGMREGEHGRTSSAGKVTLTHEGKTQTHGAGAHALVAQNVGGGGGVTFSDGRSLGPAVHYGTDAPGGAVSVANTGTVQTHGTGAYGAFVQSVGGGGGSGGASAGILAVGGTAGGIGGNVAARIDEGSVTTQGRRATGVFAQSVGGGGGDGGGTVSVGVGFGLAVGGKGGSGGNGGTVDVSLGTAASGATPRLITRGEQADAIFAQSIGGGGGTGGEATSFAVGNLGIAIGGEAGSGGHGGRVNVDTYRGSILTEGAGSVAINAQSVGGGGGSGGDATAATFGLAAVAVGGKGGGGGKGGEIHVNNRVSVTTLGADAEGILAQSIGGGGGSGGSSTGLAIAIPTPKASVSLAVSVGGKGGEGGDGGKIIVVNEQIVATQGDGARGINLQSIGGGGGQGGSASAESITMAPGKSFAVSATIGGSGGEGGKGGDVEFTNKHTVATTGAHAAAATIQSIGGGGGQGGAGAAKATAEGAQAFSLTFTVGGSGAPGGDGGKLTLANAGSLETTGALSRGVLAQSIGGGGGEGAGADGDAKAGKVSATLTLGSDGGTGGKGGDITFDNAAQGVIATSGRGADGLFVQSIGGGGGVAGVAGAASAIEKAKAAEKSGKVPAPAKTPNTPAGKSSHSVTTTFTLGGNGGGGGAGGDVTVTNAGAISTEGDQASGVLVQSIGGGGGKAGAAKSSATGGDISVSATVGGRGGASGKGGVVVVNNSGSILTQGEGAYAILAQSIGGGGGSASSSDANGEGAKVALNFALGGRGGASGDGGKVDIANTATLVTYGATAVLAQSIGGGGGEGGSTDGTSSIKKPKDDKKTDAGKADDPAKQGAGSAAPDVAPKAEAKSKSVTISLGGGGTGGAAGSGEEVKVLNEAAIFTYGDQSMGVHAQSIGGGGGKGGASQSVAKGADINTAFNVGGYGGAAGSGGAVIVTNKRSIATEGLSSHGVMAQSIGGGGGSAGNAEAGASGTLSIGGGLGGSGRAGGDGGLVTLVNDAGQIVTQGFGAVGLYAQSIGAGGGSGASSTAKSQQGDDKAVNVNLAIGGAGGSGGKGGGIVVNLLGASSIQTYGDQADAIRAQSIGGGGGSGDTGTVVSVAKKEDKKDEKDGKAKEDDKSKENKSKQYTVGASLGGSGGASGDGGTVKLDLRKETALVTHGDQAVGVFAQSIGGGGGKAAVGTVDSGYGKVALTFKLGGSGGAGGKGGEIDIASAGTIHTLGAQSHGMLLQSIGGGGGAAAGVGGKAGDGVKIELGAQGGGSGGSGSHGGSVKVAHTGALLTEGAGAYGILAQSIGGGGGYAADTASLILGKKQLPLGASAAGANGNGGHVLIDVESGSQVSTLGANAAAIFAQSIGGGGGLSDTSVGAGSSLGHGVGGVVRVTVRGTVSASGENSPGIFVQNVGSRDQVDAARRTAEIAGDPESKAIGNSLVVIKANGIVQGGRGEHAAGVILGGAAYEQRVDIEADGTLYGLNGKAVLSREASTPTFINNAGLLKGDVDLGGGAHHRLTNQASGLFQSGGLVYLGDRSEFLNYGVLSPGGVGVHTTTHVMGDYRQMGSSGGTGEGVYEPDVDFRDRKADLVAVSGYSTLDGVVRPKGRYQLPDQLITVFEARDGNQLSTESTLHTVGPLVYTYTLHKPDDTRLQVGVTADFTKHPGLSEDHAALAANIQRKWDTVPAAELYDYAEVFDRFAEVGTTEQYRQVLSEIADDAKQAPASTLPGKSRAFIQLMMSCPEFRSHDTSMQEGNCYWGRILGNDTRLKSSGEDNGFHTNSLTYQIGGQKEVAPGWFLGGSFAYQDFRNRASESSVRTDGDLYNAGVVLKRQQGPWLFAGALNVGYGDNDTRRILNVAGAERQAESSWKSRHVGMRLRASYHHALPTWYVKPLFDMDVAYQKVPGYSESGAGVFNLQFDSASRWSVMLTPAVEIGGRIETRHGTLRPYVSLGASWMSDNSWNVAARLQGDPLQERFDLVTRLPRVQGEAKAGLELISGKGFEIKADYELRFAKRYVNQTGILRMAVHF
ncbi:autotransporter outer membrane beta-barrel domain-containing protein [Pusillimonas noertemannii]|uniref:Autotransporter domain-containing protein n=1 Tax=Pusillimonas noertemannii TaxID=305977 RepID=A0A2U1CQX5_9BURK|nr:autotransporter outer membrane beta-barrel domain-containing protein [Pusillimonas noertemannii]NYT67628.1 autotransporter outer membrane beta-barrel domain-containing protein [Pusillimonas noertemannii]PVY68300.1 hypothetical protein C7440_0695 [Pusillimonas noertemannii]TFL12208.1 autotransporter outer membrane beta-barrel domain-containing protein [Pusillimonas noertemannii]